MKNSFRARLGKWISVNAAIVLGILGTAGIAGAGTDVGNGMPAGIAWGQTARLTVLSPSRNVAPCAATLRFFDQRGNLLAESAEKVQPGQLVFLDLNADEALREAREGRAQVYGAVRVDPTRSWTCRGVAATLELFDDRTSKTEIVVVPPAPIVR